MWRFDEIARDDPTRALTLEQAPTPFEILDEVARSFEAAIPGGDVRFGKEQARDNSSHHRGVIQFQVAPNLFDCFFNANTGYRAQFARSTETGLAYNKNIIVRLREIIHRELDSELDGWSLEPDAIAATRTMIRKEFILGSLDEHLAKIWQCSNWIAGDGSIAIWMPQATGPRLIRDQDSWASLFRDSDHSWLDVRGAFLGLAEPYQFKSPADRARTLHERGEA